MGCFLFLSHVCHMVYIFICATLIQKYFCDLWPGHDASWRIQNSCVFCTPQFQFSPPHLLTCNSLKNSLRLTNPYQAKSWRAKRRDDFKYKWWWKGEFLVSLPSLIPKFTPSVNSDVESACALDSEQRFKFPPFWSQSQKMCIPERGFMSDYVEKELGKGRMLRRQRGVHTDALGCDTGLQHHMQWARPLPTQHLIVSGFIALWLFLFLSMFISQRYKPNKNKVLAPS